MSDTLDSFAKQWDISIRKTRFTNTDGPLIQSPSGGLPVKANDIVVKWVAPRHDGDVAHSTLEVTGPTVNPDGSLNEQAGSVFVHWVSSWPRWAADLAESCRPDGW